MLILFIYQINKKYCQYQNSKFEVARILFGKINSGKSLGGNPKITTVVVRQ